MVLFVLQEDIAQCGRNKKILLFEPKFLSRFHFIAGIENLGDGFAHDLCFHGPHIVSPVEKIKIKVMYKVINLCHIYFK